MDIRLIVPALLMACGSGSSDDSGSKSAPGDTGPGDTAEPDGDESGLAPLAELSSGACPDMSATGTSSFLSSDRERTVTVVLPDTPTDDMPVVFFFHGLLDASMSSPSAAMASGFNLQNYANEYGIVFVLPESDVMSVAGFSFYMWQADEFEGQDIVLYDDLRTCAANALSIDLTRVSAMGFSGGGLFTTVVARDRGDTLASMIELSGGSDVDIPTFATPFAEYKTPAHPVPALLMAGGSTDVWPGGGFTIVDFSAATDALQGQLAADGHFVARCEHDNGHDIPYSAVMDSWAWIDGHVFGEPSPFIDQGVGDLATGCQVVTAD